jgi:hypothetical protein
LFFPIFWTYLRFPVFFVIPFFLICDIMYCCGLLRLKCRCVAVALRHHTWFEFTLQLQSDAVAAPTASAILRPHQLMQSAI